ncbi:MAG: hydrolase [Oscillospiraceae bacterium]
MSYKDEFLQIFNENVTREGKDTFLAWLETTDFFTAPASTRFHGACENGLVMHSLNVYNAFMDHFYAEGDNKESIVLCTLLHDLCKASYYKIGSRNVKNEVTGAWEKVATYNVEDAFPFGHGEKSVFLIERFIRLKPTEAVAIRWHMGGFDEASRGGSYAISQAYDQYPLAVKLHMADLYATYLLEKGTSNVNNTKV